MAVDLTVQLINATVEIDQPQAAGNRLLGTAFLVQAPTPDGSPRVVLVTANHVLNEMPGADLRIDWRFADATGTWRMQPQFTAIRANGAPLWTRNPDRDIAVMAITAPPEFARAAIPLAWLADDASMDRYGIGPGDEMFTLGYPQGQSANAAGFPILRVGRLASYPVSPVSQFPVFLIDALIIKGYSGAPVFTTIGLRRGPQATAADPPQLVTGVLTQWGVLNGENQGYGFVTHATFIRQTIALLDAPTAAKQPAAKPPPAAPIAMPAGELR